MRLLLKARGAAQQRGISITEVLLMLCILLIFGVIMLPLYFHDYGVGAARAQVARVKADQRAIATGLEAYYVDHGSYPGWTSLTGSNKWTGKDGLGHINAYAGQHRGKYPGAAQMHSFRVRTASPFDPLKGDANRFALLTTPIAYLSTIPNDPFADTKGAAYGYYATQKGYILYSFGPDEDECPNAYGHIGDIDPAIEATDLSDLSTSPPVRLYDPNVSQPSLFLIVGPAPAWTSKYGTGAFTFDPTNGTTSEGDVWRVRN